MGVDGCFGGWGCGLLFLLMGVGGGVVVVVVGGCGDVVVVVVVVWWVGGCCWWWVRLWMVHGKCSGQCGSHAGDAST